MIVAAGLAVAGLAVTGLVVAGRTLDSGSEDPIARGSSDEPPDDSPEASSPPAPVSAPAAPDAERHARHLLVGVSESAPEPERAAARGRAEALLARALAGEDFARLAREHSTDPGSAARGGDLGWFPRRRMVAGFDEAVFNASPATIVDHVVETPFGFHVVEVLEARGPVDEPDEELVPGEVSGPRCRIEVGTVQHERGAGLFDAGRVARELRIRIRAMHTCYERNLRIEPSLDGSLLAHLTIEPSGVVRDVRVSEDGTGSDALAACVTGTLSQFRFSPGPEGGSVTYSYPFTFLRLDQPSREVAAPRGPERVPRVHGESASSERRGR